MKPMDLKIWESSFLEFARAQSFPITAVEIYRQAFAHRSYVNEYGDVAGHNERLEFLGDSVVGLVVSDLLVQSYPEFSEGVLSKKRASLVSEAALAQKAVELGLQQWLLLGKGEEASGTRQNSRILASALEALLGALYLDLGWTQAFSFVEKLFKEELIGLEAPTDHFGDYKTQLQELIQARRKLTPIYRVVDESGPQHQKVFSVEVRAGDQVLGRGEGASKKLAEQQAAKDALTKKEVSE